MTGEWLPPEAPGRPPPPPSAPEHPQQYPQPQPYGWQPPPPQPPNNDAVAGFTCGIVGISLLFFTAGLSTILSLILGIVAIPFSRKGKANVEEGRTQKHKSLASAGFVIGIVTVVASVLATIVWGLVFASVDWDALDENDDPFDEDFEITALARVVAAGARLLG